MFSTITWNPDRVFFVIPYINHPVMWYGILFAAGFIVGYFLVKRMLTDYVGDPKEALRLTDQLTLYVVAGTLIGARLGHILFYGLHYYKKHPLSVFKVWEGGLASHGGAIGVLMALAIFVWIYRKYKPQLNFLTLLDFLVVPAAFAGFCIRLGNFINQEITGIPTSVPWAVAFLNPIDGYPGVPVHPVQLYEALFYLAVFVLLWITWLKNKKSVGSGLLTGLCFLLVFAFRFVIEYLKVPQNDSFDSNGWIKMGQALSVPFVVAGFYLLVRYVRKKS